jgi:hypothetical protein
MSELVVVTQCDSSSKRLWAMPKLKLLILDAGAVIHLHELGVWQQVVDTCDVHLSEIVANDEVLFQPGDDDKYGEPIDLQPLIGSGKIQIFNVAPSDVEAFRNKFDPAYLGDLDAGEAESLAYMHKSSDDYIISSGDAIVYRVLGNIGWEERGVSLEELLQRIGLGRQVSGPYTKAFREKLSATGKTDSIWGRGQKR